MLTSLMEFKEVTEYGRLHQEAHVNSMDMEHTASFDLSMNPNARLSALSLAAPGRLLMGYTWNAAIMPTAGHRVFLISPPVTNGHLEIPWVNHLCAVNPVVEALFGLDAEERLNGLRSFNVPDEWAIILSKVPRGVLIAQETFKKRVRIAQVEDFLAWAAIAGDVYAEMRAASMQENDDDEDYDGDDSDDDYYEDDEDE